MGFLKSGLSDSCLQKWDFKTFLQVSTFQNTLNTIQTVIFFYYLKTVDYIIESVEGVQFFCLRTNKKKKYIGSNFKFKKTILNGRFSETIL